VAVVFGNDLDRERWSVSWISLSGRPWSDQHYDIGNPASCG
jgi:hypothetical protein